MRTVIALVAAVLVAPVVGLGQVLPFEGEHPPIRIMEAADGAPVEASAYGTADTFIYNLGASDFHVIGGSGPAYRFLDYPIGPNSDGTNIDVIAPIHLPSGVRIESVTTHYYDTDPASDPSGAYLLVTAVADGQAAAWGAAFPTGAPGWTTVTIPNVGHTVDNELYTYAYRIVLSRQTGSQRQALSRVVIRARRQVAPAPPTATFTDVPAGSALFQYVEALAAAGITGGCGGSEFCPNAPVTRGQMAVFLAKALGLHWAP